MPCRPFRAFVFCLILLALSLRAGLAQDIFVTPIPNAPFRATISVQRTVVRPDGSVFALHTLRGVGRDSQGRIFNETRALVPAPSNIVPVLIRVHLYDPQTRLSTMLDAQHHTFRSAVVNRPPATEPPALLYGSPAGNGLPPSQFTKEEDLGTSRLENLPVHGVRETQTVPAGSGGGQPVVVTDEYWYSADLHMNLALSHNDPRTGSVMMAVTGITLSEPDPALFQIPEGYTDAAAQPSPGQSPAHPQP